MSPSLRRIVATFSRDEETALMQLRAVLMAMESIEVTLENMSSATLQEIKPPLTALATAANQMKTALRRALNTDQLRISAHLEHQLGQTLLKWSRSIG